MIYNKAVKSFYIFSDCNMQKTSLEFDPKRNIIVPINEKCAESDGARDENEEAQKADEDECTGEAEFNYEEPASEEEIKSIQGGVEGFVAQQAVAMGITEEKELKEFLQLAELDLGSLDAEKLNPLELNKRDTVVIRKSVEEALSKCWRTKSGNLMVEPVNAEKIVRFTEYLEKHHRVISLFMLADYISSCGSTVLKDLAGAGVQVETAEGKVSLSELASQKNMEKIDQAAATGTPIDIMKAYSRQTKFEEKERGYSFSFYIKTVEQNDKSVQKTVTMEDSFWNTEQMEKLHSDLEAAGIHQSYESGGYSLEDFLENREKITAIFSEDLGIDKDETDKYFENLFLPVTSKLTVVPYDNFTVNTHLGDGEGSLELAQQKELVYQQFHVKENGIRNGDNLLKAEKELDRWWGEHNGGSGETFDEALAKEKKEYDESPMSKLEKLKFNERETLTYENNEAFRNLFLQDLTAAGYSIADLKAEAEKDPKRVFEIISEVIGKNTDYGMFEYLVVESMVAADALPDGTQGKEWIKNAGMSYIDDKYAGGEPYNVLKSHKTLCHGYGKTFTAAFTFVKEILKKEGVKKEGVNPFDNVVCLWSTSDAQNHLWNALVTVDDNGNLVITYIDPTWQDAGAPLNAVDDEHYYGTVKEKVDRDHAAVLENMKEWNLVTFQEKLNDIVMQNDLSRYDPKAHKKEVRIKLNKEAYEAIKKTKEEHREKKEVVEIDDQGSVDRIMERIRMIEMGNQTEDTSGVDTLETVREKKEKETVGFIHSLREKIQGSKKAE